MNSDEPVEERLRRAASMIDGGRGREAAAALEPLAEAGHPAAQALLAWLLQTGRGVQRDLPRAKHWYTASAEQGYALGQFHLARLHQKEGDRQAAAFWFEQAAAQEFAPALFRLALDHLSKGDEGRAEALLRCAESSGHLPAKVRLARLLLRRSKNLPVRARALVDIAVTTLRIVGAATKDRSDLRILY